MSEPKQGIAVELAAAVAVDVAAAVAAAVAVAELDWQRGFPEPPPPRRWLENLGPF